MVTQMNIMKPYKWCAAASVLLVVVCLLSLLISGLNLGLDFTGGIQINLEFATAVSAEDIKNALAQSEWQTATVQQANNAQDFLLSLAIQTTNDVAGSAKALAAHLHSALGVDIEIKQSSFIGAQIGDELRDQSGLGFVVAILCMMVYLAVRFQYKFALAAVVALLHDVIIVIGVFSLLNLTFDVAVLAAVLAIVGYSINDTIVVFDRIRETLYAHKNTHMLTAINRSVQATLERTIMTSATTLLVVISILLLGGASLYLFALSLAIGIIVGTYSSIFVAPNVLLALKLTRENVVPEKNEQLDVMP